MRRASLAGKIMSPKEPAQGTSAPITPYRRVLVAGATGFVGRALVPALLERGLSVRASARHLRGEPSRPNLEVMLCDLLDPAQLPALLEGVDAAYYLVHSLGRQGYRELDRRAAGAFAEAAGRSAVRRIIYLGGVAPRGLASEHLASRLEVGRVLRSGPVPALELRAAMIVGAGSASWQIVRDLSLRLPAMVLPAWLNSRLSPIAIDDVVHALTAGLDVPLPESAYYDIPGPETLTGKEILRRVAALDGRKIAMVSLPWLTPQLSALWLRLVTRANFAVARELVFGLTDDLLPESRRYWDLIGYHPAYSFDEAARRALQSERARPGSVSRVGQLEEALVRRIGPHLGRHPRPT